VYISVDMEGIAGIATLDQVTRGGSGYVRAQHLMTAETNAAIAGAFDAGAEAVLVNDSHGTQDNLIHEELDPRARLIFGTPKLDCMAEGVSSDHDVAFFLGYHAAAGAPGVLAHTFSGHFLSVRLNGAPVSEAEVNSLQAAEVGVPLGLLTGDDVICAATKSLPGVELVEVKEAHGYTAVNSLSPAQARRLIHDAAGTAVTKAPTLKPVSIPAELAVEIDMPNPIGAEYGALIPGVRRTGDLTIAGTFASPREMLGFICVAYELAAAAQRARLPLIQRV
jgi:D-amino peptidase